MGGSAQYVDEDDNGQQLPYTLSYLGVGTVTQQSAVTPKDSGEEKFSQWTAYAVYLVNYFIWAR